MIKTSILIIGIVTIIIANTCVLIYSISYFCALNQFVGAKDLNFWQYLQIFVQACFDIAAIYCLIKILPRTKK